MDTAILADPTTKKALVSISATSHQDHKIRQNSNLNSSAARDERRSATGLSTRMMQLQTTALSFVSWSASWSEEKSISKSGNSRA